jgi:hypothetical protein
MRSVMGSLKRFPKCPCPRDAKVRAQRRPAARKRRLLRRGDCCEYTADLLIEDQVIVELKVVGALSDVHVPQCRNYLRATGKPLCLLINFGRPKIEIRRIAPSFACSVAQA